MEKLALTCLGCVGLLAIVAVLNLVLAWILEWAWNLVVPLFGGPRIDFVVACAICVLFSLIAGLFRSSQGQS